MTTKNTHRPGYKHTSIGWIPEEWNCVQQNIVVNYISGITYKKTEWKKSGTPVIRLQNLTGNGNDYYYSNINMSEHQ